MVLCLLNKKRKWLSFRGHIEIPKIYKLNMSRVWFKKVQNWECVVVDRNIKKIRLSIIIHEGSMIGTWERFIVFFLLLVYV